MATAPYIQPFGFHQIIAYNATTGAEYGRADIVGTAELNRSLEVVTNGGGSFADITAAANGAATSEGTITLKEKPDWLFEVMNGQAATVSAAETGGAVVAIINNEGTSVVDAATGIATATIKSGSEASVMFAKYVVVAASATTVDVYAYNSADFSRTGVVYSGEGTLIAAGLTITASTAVEVVDDTNSTSTGIELTGGSGTIGMTIGDTAEYYTRPINSGSRVVSVGGTNENFVEVGIILNRAKAPDGIMESLEVFRCLFSGMPESMTEKAYQEISVTFTPILDQCVNKVYELRSIKPNDRCAA